MNTQLAERIVVGIFRLSGLLTKTGNRLASEVSLTQQKWVLLEALNKKGRSALSELGQSLLVTKANITGMISRLERDGLVRKVQDAEDRRVWWVELTEQGRLSLSQMAVIQSEWFNHCFADFSEEEMESFLTTMRKLTRTVMDVSS